MERRIVILDNYDSFTYNIVHEIAMIDEQYEVFQNDTQSVDDILKQNPSHLILGPGPRTPSEAGIMMELIDTVVGKIPILGICLGHQALGQYFGAKLTQAPTVRHGKKEWINHTRDSIFSNVPDPLQIGRYHSLCIVDTPPELLILSRSTDGVIQSFKHNEHPIFGVQFHPESVLSFEAPLIFRNFIFGVH